MVTLKEATETVLKNMTEEYIIGCEDGKSLWAFYTLHESVNFDPEECYIMDAVYTVDKETGKFGWMDTIEFVATESYRKRNWRGKIVSKFLDVSDYLPEKNRKAAKQWFNNS